MTLKELLNALERDIFATLMKYIGDTEDMRPDELANVFISAALLSAAKGYLLSEPQPSESQFVKAAKSLYNTVLDAKQEAEGKKIIL